MFQINISGEKNDKVKISLLSKYLGKIKIK